MALESGRRGLARSVVAIGPAGLWEEHPPPHVPYVFGALRFAAPRFPNVLKAAVRAGLFREAAFAVPISVGCRQMPADDAVRVVEDLARSRAFEATFEASRSPFSGPDIAVPVTVAFGDRDYIVTRSSPYRNGLPAHTRWFTMKGWGHVPMWVDSIGVSRLILKGTA